MEVKPELPVLYTELAAWWPLLSAPEDYAEEAEFFRQTILLVGATQPETLLELGSGGGNNASHLKRHFQMTLVDRAPGMLAVSQALNPQCEHLAGDMRTVRLGRQFDAVFIQDAITYMATQADLYLAIETASVHCKPGGVVLLAPDNTRETFRPATDHGGHDGEGRGLRYLEWFWDPDPADSSYLSEMVYLLREGETVRCVHDRHICGLFGQDEWLEMMERAGLRARAVPFEHSEYAEGACPVFVGVKEGG